MIRRLALVLLLGLLGGCSAFEFAYDNADTWLRWQGGRYLEFGGEQGRALDAGIAAFLIYTHFERTSARTSFGVTIPSGCRQRRACAAISSDWRTGWEP